MVLPAASARAPLPGQHEQREVPGNDLADDADRLAQRVGEVIAADRDRLAVDLVGPAGVVAQAVDHRGQVALRLGDRLAVVERLELGQLVDVLLDQVGQLVHEPAAVGGVHLAPGPDSNALRAALTARSTSAASPSATWR